jgi:hypothetical protein
LLETRLGIIDFEFVFILFVAKELKVSLENIKDCIYEVCKVLNEESKHSSNQSVKSVREVTLSFRTENPMAVNHHENVSTLTASSSSSSLQQQSQDTNENPPHLSSNRIFLDVNGVQYGFDYRKTADPELSSKELAHKFCSWKGVELVQPYLIAHNIVDDLQINKVLEEKCFLPLQNAILHKIREEETKTELEGDVL